MSSGEPSVQSQAGTWLLQADAAARAGCSLSAIRKWRRTGAVAARMTTNAAGQERVEVRLEDVLARVGQHPGDPRSPAAAADDERLPPPGTVIVALHDLEALFERIADTEGRLEQAENKLQVAEDEARFLLGRLAEVRQQLETERARAAAPPPAQPVQSAPSPPSSPPPDRAAAVRPVRSPRPAPPPQPLPVNLTSLGADLHRLYVQLHSSRPSKDSSPGALRQRRRTLAAYDSALLTACRALGVATGRRQGPPLTAEYRTALSRALAEAGLDVRVPPQGARAAP